MTEKNNTSEDESTNKENSAESNEKGSTPNTKKTSKIDLLIATSRVGIAVIELLRDKEKSKVSVNKDSISDKENMVNMEMPLNIANSIEVVLNERNKISYPKAALILGGTIAAVSCGSGYLISEVMEEQQSYPSYNYYPQNNTSSGDRQTAEIDLPLQDKHMEVVRLINETESMNARQKEEYKKKLPIMSDRHIAELKHILLTEKERLSKIN